MLGQKEVITLLGQNDPTLTVALFVEDDLGPEDVQIIHKAFQSNTMVTELMLDSNQIGEEGARLVADILKTNKTLTILWLNDETIGATGAKYIADALKVNQTLKKLNLLGSIIGPEGAQYIAEALKVNQTLTELNISNNRLGAEGVGYIAEALKVNQTLTHLVISNNQMGTDGGKFLYAALRVNHSLISLEVTSALEVKVYIMEGLKRHGMLLHVEGIGIHPDMTKYFQRNKNAHKRALEAANAIRAIVKLDYRRRGHMQQGDVLLKIANEVWASRWQRKWWLPEEGGTYGQEPQKSKRRRRRQVNSCIGCNEYPALFKEDTDASRVFCSSYCQLIDFYELPDFRGMTPDQIKLNLQRGY